MTPITPDLLKRIEFLPDGTATLDKQVWYTSWAEFAQAQVQRGIIKLHEVEEYDADTGHVPNTFIETVYVKNRRLH